MRTARMSCIERGTLQPDGSPGFAYNLQFNIGQTDQGSDSPSSDLDPTGLPAGFSNLMQWRVDYLALYIMYNPNPNPFNTLRPGNYPNYPSIFIPVSRLEWGWSAYAVFNPANNEWPQSPTAPPGQFNNPNAKTNPTQFPTWLHCYQEVTTGWQTTPN